MRSSSLKLPKRRRFQGRPLDPDTSWKYLHSERVLCGPRVSNCLTETVPGAYSRSRHKLEIFAFWEDFMRSSSFNLSKRRRFQGRPLDPVRKLTSILPKTLSDFGSKRNLRLFRQEEWINYFKWSDFIRVWRAKFATRANMNLFSKSQMTFFSEKRFQKTQKKLLNKNASPPLRPWPSPHPRRIPLFKKSRPRGEETLYGSITFQLFVFFCTGYLYPHWSFLKSTSPMAGLTLWNLGTIRGTFRPLN